MKTLLSTTAAFLGASLLSSGASAADAGSAGTDFEIKPLPAACRLLPAELRKREATLLKELRLRIETATPLPDGYALRLKPDDDNLRLAADVIAIERQCCPFLQFRLTFAQESRALVLEIRGPAGSRALLAQVLQLPDAAAKP
jgi:hypothetical protein